MTLLHSNWLRDITLSRNGYVAILKYFHYPALTDRGKMNYFLLLLALASGASGQLPEVAELRDDIQLLKNEMVAMKLHYEAEIENLRQQLAGDFTFQMHY